MQRIKSIGVLSSAKMVGAIYGCIGLAVIPFALFPWFGMVSGQRFVFLLAPILYAGMGFVFGAIGAFLYNLAAKWMGGIEIELESPLAMAPNQIGVIWPAPGRDDSVR